MNVKYVTSTPLLCSAFLNGGSVYVSVAMNYYAKLFINMNNVSPVQSCCLLETAS